MSGTAFKKFSNALLTCNGPVRLGIRAMRNAVFDGRAYALIIRHVVVSTVQNKEQLD